MEAGVAGEFRVERGGEEVALASGDDGAIFEGGDGVGGEGGRIDARGADEDGVEGAALETFNIEVGLEAIDLAAEGVAVDGDVHHLDTGAVEAIDLLCEEDGARAGAPDGLAAGAEFVRGPS